MIHIVHYLARWYLVGDTVRIDNTKYTRSSSNHHSHVTSPSLGIRLCRSPHFAMATDYQRSSSDHHVLYYNPYSICSLMVLHTLAWRGTAKRPEDEISVQTKVIDIYHEEQLSENFLCNINDHGQVSTAVDPLTLVHGPTVPCTLRVFMRAYLCLLCLCGCVCMGVYV